jgi:hypothetical protein
VGAATGGRIRSSAGRAPALLAVLTLVVAAFQVLHPATPARADAIGFGKSVLAAPAQVRPTSLQFGPDGRLYVLNQDGTIHIYGIVRNGPNDYAVTSTETITAIKFIPNHDDDGTLDNSFVARSCTAPCREATGMVVTGTASRPVLYVSSSDPRFGGASRGDLGLDTNSGIVSRLTWDPATSSWAETDLVRGLPRSEENHSVNGMALDTATNTLYLAAGGNTNEGAPSYVFAYLPEYALSAAILSIDLGAIGDTTYDLPTLNDASRPDDPSKPGWDLGDPFGGNNGLNQAVIVPGGPVQIYASGFRNPYDLLIASVGGHAGTMYATDNGYNAGEGGTPGGEGTSTCTNARNDTSPVTGYDSLHRVAGPGYYGGHPNPTRGNNANTFGGQTPVPDSAVDPRQCDFLASAGNGQTPQRPSIGYDISSTDGVAEYTASDFGGALRGDLISAEWDGYVDRWQLGADGTAVTNQSTLFSSVSTHPIDLTTTGDDGPFPGTIWLADHDNGAIYVFEPNDFGGGGGGGPCTGADDASLDEDGDGYTNADEIDNGTDPCSSADRPTDADGDHVSDLNDPDDDNDGLPDTSDAWAVDTANGRTTALPLSHPFDDTDTNAGGLLNLGFTGLMTNGSASYASLYDPTKLTAGGAGGVLTIDQVGPGDALGAQNSQTYAFQYGFALSSAHGAVFTPHTRVLSPFAGVATTGTESEGLQLGTGDQDNYVKLVAAAAGGGSIALLEESAGSVVTTRSVPATLSSSGSVDLFLAVNPATRTVQPSYQVSDGTTTGPRTNLGAPLALPAAWFSRTALATGVIATSGGAPSFPATWDMFEVQFPRFRPDAQVRLSGAAAYTGDDVYDPTGTSQSASVRAAAGTTKTFSVNVQNDGATSDGFLLRGPGSTAGFTVRYLAGPTDITTAVVNGTYRLTNVAVGGAKSISMRVTVAKGVAAGRSKSSLVTATSTHSGSAVDGVRTVVTVG